MSEGPALPAVRRWIRCLWLLAASLLILPALAFAAALGLLAVSWRGRALSAGVLAGGTALLWLAMARGRSVARCRSRRAASLLALVGVASVLVVWGTGPRGTGGDASLVVEHIATRAASAGSALPAGSWLPEADLVALGIGLAPFLDPLIDRPAAARLRELVTPKYEALAADPALRDFGSALGSCFRELLLLPFDDGQAVAIVPRRGASAPAPRTTLVFLHGSGGNFAVYWQALAPLARRHGIALVFPTFGAGNWSRPGGVEVILAAKRSACERWGLSSDRVVLAALSNGGWGVTGVLESEPRSFRGVALISAVLDRQATAGAAQTGALRGLPVLVVHGEADDRVPFQAIAPALRRLEMAGADMTRRLFPGEDHFVLFARLEEILAELGRWALETTR